MLCLCYKKLYDIVTANNIKRFMASDIWCLFYYKELSMKVIDKEKLIQAINNSNCEHFDLRDIEKIINNFGDDWFIEDGAWKKICNDDD